MTEESQNNGTNGTNTYEFKAEINQLMHLIINSLYSNKDIFLRELISNASDAIDKIKHLGLTDSNQFSTGTEFVIKIVPNKSTNTLTITDTGIGMTKNDLINNLGMIARSGTKLFMEKLKESQNNVDMIGQFGVGFYSTYLVSSHVDVYTKNNDDVNAYKWTSNSNGTFTIEELDEQTFNSLGFKRGTSIVMHLKDDSLDYLETNKLKEIIKTHSKFVSYDILLQVEKTKDVVEEQNEDEENESDNEDNEHNENDDEPKVEEVDEEEDKVSKKVETKKVTTLEYEKQNEVPIWTRNKEDITEEELKSFYKSLSGDWQDYLAFKQFNIEGDVEFRSMLFVPSAMPFDMLNQHKKLNNLKLYVRKVFITDDCKDYCPEWLSFVKGVIDCRDLSLNVSREILQKSRTMKVIKNNIMKKSMELFEELAEDPEKYKKFYEAFGNNLKLGVYEETNFKDRLLKLLRYESTESENTSLNSYCTNMKENQDSIYYISGEDDVVKNSPFIEKCKKKGFEVLYMTNPIDEYVMQQVKEYKFNDKTFKFVSLTKEGFKLDDNEDLTKYDALCKALKDVLGNKVEKVVVSSRLEESPCVLVSGEYGHSAFMDKIIKMQAMRNDNGMASFMKCKKILEVNPHHSIIKYLDTKIENSTEKSFKDLVELLFESAMLVSGFDLDSRKDFVNKLHRIVSLGLDLDQDNQDNQNNQNGQNDLNKEDQCAHGCNHDNNQESVMNQLD